MQDRRLNIAVGIATKGRREVLTTTIDLLARQTRLPDRLVICPAASTDLDEDSLKRFPAPTSVVTGAIGTCAQRNQILVTANEADVIVFFDDDFFADSCYLANLEETFLAHPKIVAATGYLLADDTKGPGLSVDQGLKIVRNEVKSPDDGKSPVECYGVYGCNMAFRLEPVRRYGILFDENLPLYGWQEDIDFSRRLATYGEIVVCNTLRGVHLATKAGRTSGFRFGYSQIANPIYLIRKGTISWRHAGRLMWGNLLSNLVRSFHPEPWIDRKGRLKGNLIALGDIARGRISPLRVLKLDL
jgi:GT2 family glycosyltransferase